MGYPWLALHSWEPFSIDALGLVTLLGSEEINACIGRLVPSRWLEYMPLLAGFVIAGDRFKTKDPSFHLYNISSGIHTTDISSWLTRWMLAQNFEVTRSTVDWEIVEEPRKWWYYHLISFAISFCLTGFLVVMSVLSKDWYGLANSVSIIVSIVVRVYIIEANRNAIDIKVKAAQPYPGTYQSALRKWESDSTRSISDKPTENARQDGTHWKHEQAKVMVIMSDSKAVTMFIPEQLVIPVFVRNPEPRTSWLYHLFRWIGWIAFAVHIIALGMTKLASQMYTVALLVIPTVLTCWQFGCDDSRYDRNWKKFSTKDVAPTYTCWIGSHLRATVSEWPKDVEFKKENDVWQRRLSKEITSRSQRSERRQDLYAWLNLTAEEEQSLSKWDLLPHIRNNDDTWVKDYNAKKGLIQGSPPNIRAMKDVLKTNANEHRHKGVFRSQKAASIDQQPAAYAENPLEPQGPQRTNTGLNASGMIS